MDIQQLAIFGIVFIVLLGPLMFIHELGHFLAAKRAGIRVEEFGMGFPPRMLTLFRRGETIYSLNWLPIGAFVRMTGEEDPTDPKSFAAASKRWRLITLFAGPFMNFLGGFVIIALAYLLFASRPTEYQFRINSVNPGSPAEQIGLKAGDTILSVNGVDMLQKPPASEDDPLRVNFSNVALRQSVLASIGKPIELVVLRRADPNDEKSAVQTVILKSEFPADVNREAPLGVRLSFNITKAERVANSIPDAFSRAFSDVSRVFIGMVTIPAQLMRQTVPLEMLRPVSVVGITNMGVEMIEQSDIEGLFPFVQFAGFISIVLGISNLLPLPALDGGRIVFVLIEWIRGRRIDPRREQWVHAMGMMVLLALSAVIIVMDIVRPISFR
jgi:regulator of sigma E protease